MINPCFPRQSRGARPARRRRAGSLRGGGAGRQASGERRSRDEGVRPELRRGFSSLPFWLAFFFFFPLLSLPLPFLFVKGGGRQRRAAVSGRGLEFHLNDCPCAHAAPRSRPACAPQPAPADRGPAGGRPRRGPGTGSPRPPRPDLAVLGRAALASPASQTPDEVREARRRRARREPPLPPPSLEEVCGSRALSALGRAPMSAAGRSAGRRPPQP